MKLFTTIIAIIFSLSASCQVYDTPPYINANIPTPLDFFSDTTSVRIVPFGGNSITFTLSDSIGNSISFENYMGKSTIEIEGDTMQSVRQLFNELIKYQKLYNLSQKVMDNISDDGRIWANRIDTFKHDAINYKKKSELLFNQ